MTDIAIRAQSLSKRYEIYDAPRDRLKQLVAPLLQRVAGRPPRQYFREFWALKDVSFEIKKGEIVGIIGRNGSGKSTLLQLICGTLSPTVGCVEKYGRVAALLELGAGFNPEFTGRENVYMNATVLGLTQQEIQNRFPEIAAFADIGDFIDQPVKHYSSGMYARLAFAVAINVDPSILIVDEALAVGDEPFQRKCFARIETIKRNGGTILFVSHASSAIVALCDRAILLHGGRRLYTGSPKTAISWYQKLVNAPDHSEQIALEIARLDLSTVAPSEHPASPDAGDAAEQRVSANLAGHGESLFSDSRDESSFDPNLVSQSRVIYQSNGAEISNPRIQTLDGRWVNNLVKGKRYRICCEVKFDVNANNVRFFSMFKTVQGIELGGSTYPTVRSTGISFEKNQIVQVCFDFDCNLRPDIYFFNCGVASHSMLLHRIVDAGVFRVMSDKDNSAIGVVDFGCSSAIQAINANPFPSVSEGV